MKKLQPVSHFNEKQAVFVIYLFHKCLLNQ